MKNQRYLLAALATAMCAGGSVAVAHDHEKDEPVTSGNFISKAAVAGMAEVELGKAALNKSQDQDIREFAQRMVADHSKANAELMAIAKRKNMTPPADLDAKHRKMADELKSKSGKEFDAAYARHMAKDHDKAVGLFSRASESKQVDSELSGFARKTLPTLQEHKRMADDLNARKGGAAASASTHDKQHHASGNQ
jgi:putative membrane protein